MKNNQVANPSIQLFSPHARQKEVLAHPARFKVVACGRRWGKTTLALIQCVENILKGQQGWWVVPIYKDAAEVWRELKQILAPVIINKNETDKRIEIVTGGVITVRSADSERGLRGVGLDFLVLDEAALIDVEMWQAALRPTLSDKEGKALLLSTPRGRNWFYHAFLRGQSHEMGYAAWQFPTITSPTVSPSEIDDAQRELPEAIFRQEYLAEFTEDGGLVFRHVRACIKAGETEPQFGNTYSMSVDWGQLNDWTVSVVINDGTKQVVEIDRFNQIDWAIQRARIAALAHKWEVGNILAEANAMGSPNIEALQNEGLPVIGFTTTQDTKSDIIRALVLAFERGQIGIPDDARLITELESFEAERLPSGKWRYGAPQGMHDDMVIALALANWQAQSGSGVFGEVKYADPYQFNSGNY